MKKCTLCKIKPADKTGSHIVPHFLLKWIDNEIGKYDRDKEIGFIIDEYSTATYFGRSILPEKLNELYGKITKELIANRNPFVMDHIFCSECETKFSILESEYAKTIDYFKDSDYKNRINPTIGFLFWTSIIWRISINMENSLILKPKEEEKIRRLLNNHLKISLLDINVAAICSDNDVHGLYYRLIRCPNYSKNEATMLFCHPKHQMPYSIIIDEYVMFFYFKPGYIDNLVQSFFGFEKILRKAQANNISDGEIVSFIDNSSFKNNLTNVFKLVSSKRFDYYYWLFDEMHKKFSNRDEQMPNKIKQQIIENLLQSEEKLGKKYTKNALFEAIFKEMVKYIS